MRKISTPDRMIPGRLGAEAIEEPPDPLGLLLNRTFLPFAGYSWVQDMFIFLLLEKMEASS